MHNHMSSTTSAVSLSFYIMYLKLCEITKTSDAHHLYKAILHNCMLLFYNLLPFNLPITFKVILLLSITGGYALFAIHWNSPP